MNSQSQMDRRCDSVRIVRYQYLYLSFVPHPCRYLTVGAMDGRFAAEFGGGQ